MFKLLSFLHLSRKEMYIKLNAVDYKIWGTMQDRVYARKVTSVDELKQHISDEWRSFISS